MHGALSKRGAFVRSPGPEFATGEQEPYVASVMPAPLKKIRHFARHRMRASSYIDDLSVLTPSGEHCRFSMQVQTFHKGTASTMLITKLVREVLAYKKRTQPTDTGV